MSLYHNLKKYKSQIPKTLKWKTYKESKKLDLSNKTVEKISVVLCILRTRLVSLFFSAL